MKRLIFAALVAVILLLPAWAGAATYYVAQTGNGDADGTSYLHRASVAYHNAGSGVFANLDGDTVQLTGTITTRIIPPDSGSAGNVVTYDGDDGVNPDALIRVTGDKGQIKFDGIDYLTFNQIFFDGQNESSQVGLESWGQSEYITVTNCHFEEHQRKGIAMWNSQYYEGAGTRSACRYWTVGGSAGNGNTFYNVGTSTAANIMSVWWSNNLVFSYNTIYSDKAPFGLGRSGLVIEDSGYVLVEYNNFYNLTNEDGIGGKNADHVIVRYNTSHDMQGGSGDINSQGSGINMAYSVGPLPCRDWYVYGNTSYNNNKVGILVMCGATNINIWSNLIYSNGMAGISVVQSSGATTIKIYNNTIVNSGELWGLLLAHNIYIAAATSAIIKNNIFYSSVKQAQVVLGSTSGVTMDYNHYYYTGGTPTVYWGGTYYNYNALPGSQEDNATTGNPNFTNVSANDYTLSGTSPCKDTGADLSGLAGSVTIQGADGYPGTVNMYWDDGLDPNNTDFSTTPPTVQTLKQDDYGGVWEKGAYVFQAEQEDPPVGNNDFSEDANAKAVWLFDLGGFYADGKGTNTLEAPGSACESSETILNDGEYMEIGRYAAKYRGSAIVKAGGYPAGCKIKLKLKRTGTLTDRIFTISEIPLSGNNLDLASAETVASMNPADISGSAFTVYEFETTHDLTEGNMLVLWVTGTPEAANYVSFSIDTDSNVNLGDIIWYDYVAGAYGGATGDWDFYIEIWEGAAGSEPTQNTSSPLQGTADADFESGSSEYLKVTDANLDSGFPGKSGETNRTFSILARMNNESQPTDTNYMTIASKTAAGQESYRFDVYNDGGTVKLRLQLYDGAAWKVYTHASGLTNATSYVVMAGWDHTTNTAYLDAASYSTSWTRLGTRIEDNANDFDLNIGTADCEIGSNSGGADYFDGKIDEVVVTGDIISAAEFLDYANGEYGEPGVSGQSMSTSADLTAAGTHTITLTLDREGFMENGSGTFTVTYDYPASAQTYTYTGKGGVGNLETYWQRQAVAGDRVVTINDAAVSDDIALPDGCTWTDAQDNAIVVAGALAGLDSYPANTVAIAGTFTVGTGKDITTLVGFQQLDTDVYFIQENLTENWTIAASSIVIQGSGFTLTGTLTLNVGANYNVINCLDISGAVTDNGTGNIIRETCGGGFGSNRFVLPLIF